MVLNALGNWGYRVSFSKAQIASTTVNYMGLLLTLTSKITPAQRLRALTRTPRPQTKRELLSLIRSIKLLLNMGPKFCPLRKISLPSYSRKLRWTLIGPHLSPHPNTDYYQTFTTGPFSLLTWLHQSFFPFCTFSTRTCLRDSVPKKGRHMGAFSLLI